MNQSPNGRRRRAAVGRPGLVGGCAVRLLLLITICLTVVAATRAEAGDRQSPASATATAEAYLDRAIAHYRKGEDDKAIADAGAALLIKPDLEAAYALRASAY